MAGKIKLENLDSDETALVRKLLSAEHNGQCNNSRLRESLTWEAIKYWEVRNRLLGRGIVGKALGGPGGKTILTADIEDGTRNVAADKTKNAADKKQKKIQEKELYKPISAQLETNWVGEQDYNQHLVRICANLGSKRTGGKWSRPDICLVGVQKFKFIKEPVFDLVSFEVKTFEAVSVQGVFEALSHRQATNRAYVIYHISQGDFDEIDEAGRITALAEKHGIGVILAADPADQFSWHESVRAERWEPDPANLNDFIEQVFDKKDHDDIITMVR